MSDKYKDSKKTFYEAVNRRVHEPIKHKTYKNVNEDLIFFHKEVSYRFSFFKHLASVYIEYVYIASVYITLSSKAFQYFYYF